MTRRAGSRPAGGRSTSGFDTLRLTTPKAIAIDSETTAMMINFQCFDKLRKLRVLKSMRVFYDTQAHLNAGSRSGPATRTTFRLCCYNANGVGQEACPEFSSAIGVTRARVKRVASTNRWP